MISQKGGARDGINGALQPGRPRLGGDVAASRVRMRYLSFLCAIQADRGRHPSKRVNWLKFCRRCGADISKSARGVRLCGDCL